MGEGTKNKEKRGQGTGDGGQKTKKTGQGTGHSPFLVMGQRAKGPKGQRAKGPGPKDLFHKN